jgi:hypothetical protein
MLRRVGETVSNIEPDPDLSPSLKCLVILTTGANMTETRPGASDHDRSFECREESGRLGCAWQPAGGYSRRLYGIKRPLIEARRVHKPRGCDVCKR